MCPEKANIFLVEDDNVVIAATKMVLEDSGHDVTLIAQSKQEAIDSIPELNRHGIQVAVVDGNLSRSSRSEQDGKEIITAIRQAFSTIVTIGRSSLYPIEGADLNCPKLDVSATKLADIITKLK